MPQMPQMPDLPQVPELHLPQLPDLHLPHLPQVRKKKEKKRRKLLPLLILIGVVALIVTRRRGGGSQTAVGTAPAGAKPVPEHDPARATPTTTSKVETPPSTATPGTTADAEMGVTSAESAADVADQPAPISSEDAPGTLTPDELAESAPDLATWVEGNRSETDDQGSVDADEGVTGTDDSAEVVPEQDESNTSTVPTPAAASTAVNATEGDGWIHVDNGSCPPEFPIKGNANSRIYHVPGSRMYEPTIPEICFATEEAAQTHGFRAPKG
jgi:hypothetical protein